tara:strand:- start:51 stop:635 length:585 start_codon:yes stop_codon:yes gene_type:complete
MRIGLVVVDAWSVSKDILSYGQKIHKNEPPIWSSEVKDNVKNFSDFLSYVCDTERQKGTTIIHSFGVNNSDLLEKEKGNVSELVVDDEDKITFANQLGKTINENNIDEVYFCGFHFGKCIQMHIKETSRYLRDNNKKLWRKSRNIALNLCMILPPPDNAELKKHKNSWKEDINERAYSYFMWSPWRFEKILGNG